MNKLQGGLATALLSTTLLVAGCLGESATNGNTAPGSSSKGDTSSTSVPGGTQMDMGVDMATSLKQDAGQTTTDAGGMPQQDGGVTMMPPNSKPVDPNSLPQAQLFACKDPSTPLASPARFRRVVDTEWTRAMGAKYNSDAAKNPLQANPSNPYSTYAREVSIDTATLDQYLAMEFPLKTEGLKYVGCFSQQDSPDETCISGFVTELLERRVYFRPPTQEEIDQIVTLAKKNLAKESSNNQDRKGTITQVFRGAWLTSGALFRSEFGQSQQPDGRYKLSDWELGRALANSLSDRSPAAPLSLQGQGLVEQGSLADIQNAVMDGTISKPEVIAEIVRRHIAGVDAGEMGLNTKLEFDGSNVVYPTSIRSIADTKERVRAMSAWVGRRDLEQDFGNITYRPDASRRTNHSQYWMSDKLTRFFREWLGYENAGNVFKEHPSATSRFNPKGEYRNVTNWAYKDLTSPPTVSSEIRYAEFLDNAIARVVVGDKDVIRNLMTTRDFYVQPGGPDGYFTRPAQGFLYDIDTRQTTIQNTRADRWRTMPQQQRAGVLTHPVWLAAHGGNFENDPSLVHRGKWIREHILCQSVPDLPITVDAALSPESADLSARQRMMDQVDNRAFCKDRDENGELHEDCPQDQKTVKYCAGCHQFMNPLGYPFEIYNHAGYVRAEDHGNMPDGSATLAIIPPGDNALSEGMVVKDAVELAGLFGESTRVKRCVIRQSFRYFMGRDETRADACVLTAMEQTYDQSGGSFIEMITTLLSSDTFLYRTRYTEAER